MIPQANDNFEDSAPLRRWTPTAIDLVNPFDQEPSHAPAIDAPTTLLQRHRFQGLPPGTIVGELRGRRAPWRRHDG